MTSGGSHDDAVSALRSFFEPASVAVIGASRRRDSVGGKIFRNLLDSDFDGPVYPVNPGAEVIQTVSAHPSVLDVPGPVELAVVAVPATGVAEVAEQCGRKGVRALLVISAGFSEAGAAGAERERELVEICREHGMRLVGPNCLGLLSTGAPKALNATFGPLMPDRGEVAFLSQSGALGLAIIEYSRSLQIGVSSFVSVGNKADVSGNDLIRYWEQDPATRVILLYLESFGNPRRFARIARRVGRSKPIVAVKSGRSVAGARASSSHTGALVSASDVTVDALFRQSGVIRTDTLAEMFDVAQLLDRARPPAGRRVAILTNAGGPGIMCADACEALGLEVAELGEATRERLAEFLPAEAALANPVDMIATASAEQYARALRDLAASGEADAVIVVGVHVQTPVAEIHAAIEDAAADLDLPVLAVLMSPAPLSSVARLPVYRFPEDAAGALAQAARYGEWLRRPDEPEPELEGIDAAPAAAVIADALDGDDGWLSPVAVGEVLAAYGIAVARSEIVAGPAEAGAAAERIGRPVALKGIAPGLVHKTDAGAVRLDLVGAEAVEAAAAEIEAAIAAAGFESEGFLVQEMAPDGVEVLVGVVHDPLFGPVVVCAAGGVSAELIKDVSVRITPLRRGEAREMVSSLRTYPLLEGYRGSPPADIDSLVETLLRVSAMVEAHPEIAEMDLNPLLVGPTGAVAVDARIRVIRRGA